MKILIVDDDKQIVSSLIEALDTGKEEFSSAYSGKEAVELIIKEIFDFVIIDLVMPEMNGIEVLKEVKADTLITKFIMVTGYGSIETAVEAMKLGASDYLSKPVNVDELRLKVRGMTEQINIINENTVLRARLESDLDFKHMIGNSASIEKVKDMIKRVAPKTVTVFIDGGSGTGKEVVADEVFDHSRRQGNIFLKVNCGALSPTVLESELFGHEKGSFTGASALKKGLFESANNGTLFLDEIGELPLESQVKLLRVIENGEFKRVGGVETLVTDVRLIAATNKNLKHEVEEGNFREDLFYRLNVVTISLPPLDDRAEDIPLLVQKFIYLFNLKNGTTFKAFSENVLSVLMKKKWPGNIRELKNMVERILVFAPNNIVELEDLPDSLISEEVKKNAKEISGTMDEIEVNVLKATLKSTAWNIKRAAVILDIPLRTIYRKIKKYDLIEE